MPRKRGLDGSVESLRRDFELEWFWFRAHARVCSAVSFEKELKSVGLSVDSFGPLPLSVKCIIPIKLAVLRAFESKDWEGRIKTIIVNLHIQSPPRIEGVDIGFPTTTQRDQFLREVQSEGVQFPIIPKEAALFLINSGEQIQVIDFVERETNKITWSPSNPVQEIDADTTLWQIRVGSRAPHQLSRFKVKARTFPIQQEKIEIHAPIAELIFEGFGADDIIIFAEQLQRLKIDARGRVSNR